MTIASLPAKTGNIIWPGCWRDSTFPTLCPLRVDGWGAGLAGGGRHRIYIQI